MSANRQVEEEEFNGPSTKVLIKIHKLLGHNVHLAPTYLLNDMIEQFQILEKHQDK